MADFALWATAAETGLGWKPGTFMKAYSGNREGANDLALESDPVADAVLKLMKGQDEWVDNATQLWKELGEEVDEEVKKTKAWPAAPHTLTGRLKRLAPALRKAGIEYLEDREGHKRTRVKKLRRISVKERPQESPANGNFENAADASSQGLKHKENGFSKNGFGVDAKRLHEFLENPSSWFLTQARLCLQQGAPERLLNPLANAVSIDVFGSPWRWQEVLPLVREKLEDLA